MDLFDEILKQASSNNENASKQIKALDKSTSHQQTNRIRSTTDHNNHDRRNTASTSKKFTPPEPQQKPKFSIPKLSNRPKEKNNDISDRIAAFMEKKKEEERKKAIEKKRQKEKLIQMRLQTTFGGKANKKLAKQFGTTPIELQQRFGNDREHEEYLRKLQSREEEEMDRRITELRGSVMKALERKKAVDKLAPTEEERKALGRHRIAINKPNSLRHFMKEDSPGPGPSSSKNVVSTKKKSQPPPPPPPTTTTTQSISKKRPPPPGSAVDFALLMKKAEAIQRGEPPPKSPSPEPQNEPPPPPPPKKRNPFYEPLNTGTTHYNGDTSNRKQTSLNTSVSRSSLNTSSDERRPAQHSEKTNKYSIGVVKNVSNKELNSAQKQHHSKDSSSIERNRTANAQERHPKSYSSSSTTLPSTKTSASSSARNSTNHATASGSSNRMHNNSSASSNTTGAVRPIIQTGSSSTHIAPPSNAKRYLPGDIRYQGPPPSAPSRHSDTTAMSASKGNAVSRPSSSVPVGSSSSSQKDRNALNTSSRSREPERKSVVENMRRADEHRRQGDNQQQQQHQQQQQQRSSSLPQRYAGRDSRQFDRQRLAPTTSSASMRAKERMILEQRRRREMAHSYDTHSSSRYKNDDDDDDDDDEMEDEEYDSDMDDFIDDTELDDHIKRRDFEETLRMINPRYDRNRWRLRERMIDDRHMEANYRDISREELRSSKLGLLEDIREAQRGNSIAL